MKSGERFNQPGSWLCQNSQWKGTCRLRVMFTNIVLFWWHIYFKLSKVYLAKGLVPLIPTFRNLYALRSFPDPHKQHNTNWRSFLWFSDTSVKPETSLSTSMQLNVHFVLHYFPLHQRSFSRTYSSLHPSFCTPSYDQSNSWQDTFRF